MTLGFSTKFPKGKGSLSGEPTYFVEKIWYGIEVNGLLPYSDIMEWIESPNGIVPSKLGKSFKYEELTSSQKNPKFHTIRVDKKNQWKRRDDIHFVIKKRTPFCFHFAPSLTCISTQHISIKYYKNNVFPVIKIDGRKLRPFEMVFLALNDGFDNLVDFLLWFNSDFEGKIIHWTTIRY